MYTHLICVIFQKIKVGSKVLLRNSLRDSKKGNKAEDKWIGLYTINEDVGKGRFKIMNKSGVVLKKAVNCSRLKFYESSNRYGYTIIP